MRILKITLIAVISSVLMVLPSNAVDFRIGVAAQFAQIESSGSETLKDTAKVTSTTVEANAIVPSLFAELAMDNGFGVGIDHISGASDLVGSSKTSNNGASTGEDTGSQVASAEVDGITAMYFIKSFDNGLFIKAGTASADINTKETLATGSTYGNKSVDGTHYGIGYERSNDSGLFVRTMYEHTDFDTITLTGTEVGGTASSFNTIKANVDVTAIKFAVGKKF